jgi:hypothetical protein
MNDIICNKCHKKFVCKKNLNRHLKNCGIGSKTNKLIRFKCKDCGNYFSRKDSLTRHINNNRCKKNKHNVELKGNKNKIKNNNADVNLNKSKVNKLYNINKSPNSNNTYKIYNNIPIILVSFSKDGIECISSKDLPTILSSKRNIIESIISNVNLNPLKPEHHNILYSDIKSTYGEVYEDNKWVKMKIDEILGTLIESKISDLNDILNDYADFLNKKSRDKIKQTIENVDHTRPGARNKLKTYLKPILYNHRDMIIKTRKLTKEQEKEIFRKEQEAAELEALKEEIKMLKKKK